MSNQQLIKSHVFSANIEDIPLYIQVFELEKQCYVWAGIGVPKMSCLYAAMPTNRNVIPVSSLMSTSADDNNLTMAQRIAKKTGIPIILSVNLPKDRVFTSSAERYIIDILQSTRIHQS